MIKGIFVVVALTSSLTAVSTFTSSNSIDTLSAAPNVRFKSMELAAAPNVRFKSMELAAAPNVRFKSMELAAAPNVRFTENAFA